MSTYVVAATYADARRYMESRIYMAERRGAWRYVTMAADLRGLAGRAEFVYVPGWTAHPEAPEIAAAVRVAKAWGRLEP